jgi:putative ABC transport system permease protein
MFTTFGVIAIVLASVGLYGVMSFSVNQRNQEFGVRMALGADAARILRMVLGQGAWQLGLGLGLGVLATAGVAWGFSGPLTNFLFQTNPLDPLPYLGVIALVSLVSLAAILIPARRATRVDPMVALRAQ